jgi:ubiquinone/menaquinone biosynthesis C-methylase UbiE
VPELPDTRPLDEERLVREREFHDELAARYDALRMPPEPLGSLESAVVAMAGDLAAKRVLDVGCGTGDLTLALLRAGACVTAIDVSPGMLDLTRRRAELFCPGCPLPRLEAAAAEEMPFANGAFDLVVGRFILHHVDLTRAPAEIARVLAPGGIAVFAENSSRNPLLMFARERLAGRFGIPRYGTSDERPLGDEDLRRLRAAFRTVRLSYPVFDFFVIFDRQVLRFRRPLVSRALRALDRAVWRVLPPLRKYSFRVVVTATA